MEPPSPHATTFTTLTHCVRGALSQHTGTAAVPRRRAARTFASHTHTRARQRLCTLEITHPLPLLTPKQVPELIRATVPVRSRINQQTSEHKKSKQNTHCTIHQHPLTPKASDLALELTRTQTQSHKSAHTHTQAKVRTHGRTCAHSFFQQDPFLLFSTLLAK